MLLLSYCLRIESFLFLGQDLTYTGGKHLLLLIGEILLKKIMQDIIGSLEDNNLTCCVKILYVTAYLPDIINEIWDTASSLN